MNGPIVQVLFKGRTLKSVAFEGDRLRIGRMRDNDVVINNLSVSRYHAELQKSGGQIFLEDCDSENGCFVNGERIERAPVEAGDEILIGKHQLVLRAAAEGESADSVTDPGSRQGDPWDGEKTYVMDAPMPGPADRAPATDDAERAAEASETEADFTPSETHAAADALRSALDEDDGQDVDPLTGEVAGDETMHAGLVLQSNGRFDRVLRWDRPRMLVGRSRECDVVLSHPEVSRRHALLVRSAEGHEIRDLDSINGTVVNGERVQRHRLQVGDVIKIEDFELTFVLEPRPLGEEVATREPERPDAENEDNGITMLEERLDLAAAARSARRVREPGDPLPPARRAPTGEPLAAAADEDLAEASETAARAASAPRDGERSVTLELRVRVEDLPALLRTAFEAAGEQEIRLPAELCLRPTRD